MEWTSAASALVGRGVTLYGAPGGVAWEVPPHVEVRFGAVIWPTSFHRPVRRVHDPEDDYFVPFLDLAYKDGDELERAVRAYARRWGPLRLCERHHAAITHNPPQQLVPGQSVALDEADVGCSPRQTSSGGAFVEFVSDWKELASQAHAILMARVDLDQGQMVPRKRFEAMVGALPWGLAPPGVALPGPIGEPVPEDEGPDGPGRTGPVILRTRISRESAIRIATDKWLQMGGVHPTYQWTGSGFALSFSAESLFGALALRLAGHLTNARPLVMCDYCGEWFRETRRGTRCCAAEECHRARRRANDERKRSGKARPYQKRATTQGPRDV